MPLDEIITDGAGTHRGNPDIFCSEESSKLFFAEAGLADILSWDIKIILSIGESKYIDLQQNREF